MESKASAMAVNKKSIVISGINLYEGGPLSVYYDCLDAFRRAGMFRKYQLTAFVCRKDLFCQYEDLAVFVELPASRKNYLFRLYYEYVYFMEYSKKHQTDLWLSLHDITPRVRAGRLYTYCHNPSPFLKKDPAHKIWSRKCGIKNMAFLLFYQYLYRINIRAADAVIVQQEWMRTEFYRMFPVRQVITARPELPIPYPFQGLHLKNRHRIFIYAAYPRYFKNFEVLLNACLLLEEQKGPEFEVWITIDGSENKYAAGLRRKYGSLKMVKWLGIQSRETVFTLYDRADCLVFPSMMETWGLPVSEFRQSGKDMILADLPYAHETAAGYGRCMFFDPSDAGMLSGKMTDVIEGRQNYDIQRKNHYRPPAADNWEQLWELLLESV